MKIVINACYGGFSLSRKAVKRMAELQGRKCYFFTQDLSGGVFGKWIPSPKGEGRDFCWTAFDIPNPNEVLGEEKDWRSMTDAEKKKSSEIYDKHHLTDRPDDRTDKLLVKVVEELGREADGCLAELKIVEIPDGTEWDIDEYDGIETVHEKHRSWA